MITISRKTSTMIEQYDSDITIFLQDMSSQRIIKVLWIRIKLICQLRTDSASNWKFYLEFIFIFISIIDKFQISFFSLQNIDFAFPQKYYTSVSYIMIMKYCDKSFFEIFLDRWRNFDTSVNLENHFKSKEWSKRWEVQEDISFDII